MANAYKKPFVAFPKNDKAKELYKNHNDLIVFFYLQYEANYTDSFFEPGGFVVPNRACVRSERRIAKDTGLTENAIRTAKKHLMSMGLITQYKNGKYSIISTDCGLFNDDKSRNVEPDKSRNVPRNESRHNKNNKEYKDKEILSNDNIKKSEVYKITKGIG